MAINAMKEVFSLNFGFLARLQRLATMIRWSKHVNFPVLLLIFQICSQLFRISSQNQGINCKENMVAAASVFVEQTKIAHSFLPANSENCYEIVGKDRLSI